MDLLQNDGTMDQACLLPERFQCPSCPKSFVRKAHMLRHQQQHVNQRPFMCIFCSKCFKRSDVLRAHQFRCKERGMAPVPDGQSKGRKKSSCLSCVKLRTRCDHETPCTRCLELGKECIRALSSPEPHGSPRPKSRDAIPIHHLLNNPTGDDLIRRFPIRDNTVDAGIGDEEIPICEAEDSSEASHWSEEFDQNDVFVGAGIPDLDGISFDSFFGGIESLTFGSYPLHPDASQVVYAGGFMSPSALALEPRAYEIRQVLMGMASTLAVLYPENPNVLHLGPAIELLTHTELDQCVASFFINYHRHCPIIHRPTFQATTVPIALLLGTVALGAMYSPEPVKVAWMKSLLDLMEAYVFSLPGLREEFPGSPSLAVAPDEETLHYQFQQFQGAYLFVVVQYFSGNLAARRRARRHRFQTILAIARAFHLPTSQHGGVLAIPDECSFQRWARKEEEIRTMNILLALDSGMSIFNNVPHRINYCELDLPLPCHPEYFELSSYADMLRQSSFPRIRMKVIDAFQRLFLPPEEVKAAFQNEVLCCWDMLYLIHVLYTHSWQQLFGNPLNRLSATSLSLVSTVSIEPMKTALANWKTLWDEIRSGITRSAFSEMGFETSADSYWTLLKMVVSKFEDKASGSPVAGAVNGTTNGTSSDDDCRHTRSNPSGLLGQRASSPALDFMPLEVDCDSQGAHLRKILKR